MRAVPRDGAVHARTAFRGQFPGEPGGEFAGRDGVDEVAEPLGGVVGRPGRWRGRVPVGVPGPLEGDEQVGDFRVAGVRVGSVVEDEGVGARGRAATVSRP